MGFRVILCNGCELWKYIKAIEKEVRLVFKWMGAIELEIGSGKYDVIEVY